jgi:hypothetical protein
MMFWDPKQLSVFLFWPILGWIPIVVFVILFQGFTIRWCGMSSSLISNESCSQRILPPWEYCVCFVSDDIYKGNVVSVPTPNCQWYSVLPILGGPPRHSMLCHVTFAPLVIPCFLLRLLLGPIQQAAKSSTMDETGFPA